MESQMGINLLFNQLEPKGRWDHIYDWVVNTAKYIVILVELLIIIAFGIRFMFDEKNVRIQEDIDTVTQMLDTRKTQEQSINNLSIALKDIDLFSADDPFINNYTTILTLIPNKVTINDINIGLAGSSLSGEGNSLVDIKEIERNFKSSSDLGSVSLSLQQSSKQKVTFDLSFVILNSKTKKP